MPQIQAQVIISDYKHLLMAGFGNTANAPTKKGKKRDKGKDGLKDGLKDRGKDAGSSITDMLNARRPSAPPTFPPLNAEALSSLIPIDPSCAPPTPEQVKSRLTTIYGYPNFKLSPSVEVLHFEPLVLSIPNFFTPTECARYISMSKTGIPSPTVGSDSYSKSQRTSSTYHHPYSTVPELMSKALSTLGLSNTDLEMSRWEEPQTVKYTPGDYFNYHLDALGSNSDEVKGTGNDPNRLCGQRTLTALVYLNDVSAGGRTVFRDLGIGVEPEVGKALFFFPSLGGVEGCPADVRT
eukprot:CAMPEP_0118647172 /NCGR_PEP_ID=MMETSP0785-20121206/8465_1 /TAXON_ID=91992 /ORGANISM="Bolidomonas pacifica, Strain CCMP 1866" /LENGTH=293 /DNA_ID=CAMNT_0006539249 /DNA_START=158 /DNA_END=1035 /DNA_ORIENTATION=+